MLVIQKRSGNLRPARQVQERDTMVQKYELTIYDRCVSTGITEIVFLFVCFSLTSVYIQTLTHLVMILCSPIYHLIIIWFFNGAYIQGEHSVIKASE